MKGYPNGYTEASVGGTERARGEERDAQMGNGEADGKIPEGQGHRCWIKIYGSRCPHPPGMEQETGRGKGLPRPISSGSREN